MFAKLQDAKEKLAEPVDGACLSLFRLLFGLIMTLDIIRYFYYDWIFLDTIEPQIFFHYEFAPFVKPLSGDLMYVVYLLLGTASLGIALGLFYRWSCFAFLFLYTYQFLLDQTNYNNHYYLIILLSFLLLVVNGNACYSLDRKRGTTSSELIPFWNMALLRAQIVIVYFYAGVAKINVDWLSGEPVRQWLEARTYYPIAGWFFGQEIGVYFVAYGGLVFDLFVGFLLLHRSTRLWTLFPLFFFHLSNKWIFNIGVFPYLMLAITVLFFHPSWPRTAWQYFSRTGKTNTDEAASLENKPLSKGVVVFLVCYIGFNILFPLRHHLFVGNVAWNEDGHLYSWRMMLRQKEGTIHFRVIDSETQKQHMIFLQKHLTRRQIRKMKSEPRLILQFAHYLRDEFAKRGKSVEVYADCKLSLNGRPKQRYIDPEVDLAKEEHHFFRSTTWILPLAEGSSHK